MKENVSFAAIETIRELEQINLFAGDQCPMHFDDGENPWLQTENFIKIFDWDFYKSGSSSLHILTGCLILCGSIFILLIN